MAEPLPSFKKPPVTETVVGVTFSELSAWQIPHFGLYWQKTRGEFSECKAQAPLAVPVETFQHTPEDAQQVRIHLSDAMECPRCWYVSNDKKNVVQLQKDGFFFNWRKNISRR